MANVADSISSLNGLFKTVYADKLIDLVPDFAILQKKVEFVPADKETGAFYAQPVNLTQEGGFTYLGSGATQSAASALQYATPGQMKEAQVYGSELNLRSQMTYTALSRASSAGPRAFKRASAWLVEAMNNATRKRLEIAMIYGQVGIGTVSSFSVDTVVLTDASWAGGIWAGMEGAYIDIYQADLSTPRTNAQDLQIESIDADAKSITFVAITGTPVATDVLFFDGANASGTFNEMAGLQKIITNTGTLFNISAASYSLWKGTTVSSVGQISQAKLQNAIAKAVNKGLMEKVLVLVSPKAWGVLNSDQAALRVYDSSYRSAKMENAAEALVFHATNGILEVISHPMVKDGDAFVIPQDSCMRIGSVDLTFGVPGMSEQFFTLVPGYNAIELQCMADQAIFIDRPAHAVYMSGITYS